LHPSIQIPECGKQARIPQPENDPMPIYEYHCTDCDTDFEQFLRSMASQEIITCPECGGQHVKKAISLFGSMSGGSARSSAPAQACAPTG
jgi:putative FmdB family regulatory protein